MSDAQLIVDHKCVQSWSGSDVFDRQDKSSPAKAKRRYFLEFVRRMAEKHGLRHPQQQREKKFVSFDNYLRVSLVTLHAPKVEKIFFGCSYS
jgi:hypothetical protein